VGQRLGALEAVVMFGGVYSGRRVFVTGHTGFKGSWLSSWLLALGADVTGYALDPPTEPSLFEAASLSAQVRHVVADVRDPDRLERELSAARPEIVFHLAAQPIVRESYVRPRETFETNVMGTVNLLEAVRKCSTVRAVVVVTSDKCYRNGDDARRFGEDDPLGGRDPYSASKACEDLVGAAYGTSFLQDQGVTVATVRAGNVIGGGDWATDRLVPDCVRALVAAAPVEVRSPDAVRPWQHVLEPLSGYLLLAARALEDGADLAGAWNFGPAGDDSGLPVRWVVERFIEEWGTGAWAQAPGTADTPHEARHLDVDSGKAVRALGWAPAWGSREAVRRTAAWYKRFSGSPEAAASLVQQDIDAYADASSRTAGGHVGTAAG
jgi:CDP-glucose 4,6-dehydratase